MKKNLFAICIAGALSTAAAIIPATSFAQLPSIPGIGSLTGGDSGGDLTGQQDVLVRTYVSASKEVLTANSKMADALGLKDAATASKATASALTEGATSGNLADADKVVASSSDAVSAELKKGPKLDAAAKAKFSDGLGNLAKGVLKYVGLGKSIQGFTSGLKSASPLVLTKLQSGAYIAKSFPTGAKNLTTSLQNAVTYAKSNNIPVPADATKALSMI
jgi:hypothetical protein